MTRWEENHAGISVREGGRYRMKTHRAVLVVKSIDHENNLLRYDLERGEVPSTCPIDVFERQVKEEIPGEGQ